MGPKIVILAVIVSLAAALPFAEAQDYEVSPSVGRIGTFSVQPTGTEFQNYSYVDKPFGNITSTVNVSSYQRDGQVVHETIISLSSSAGKHVTVSVKPSYCRIGTDGCEYFVCEQPPGLDIRPYGNAQRKCVIISDSCAGREVRLEYSMEQLAGVVTTGKTVKCPQSFCDQVTMSISAPAISRAGDKILAEGYLTTEGEGVPSSIVVTAGAYNVKTGSSDFGYWRAPIEIKNPGRYELSAKSESCNREARTTIQLLEVKQEGPKSEILVYPKNIDVELGGNALLAVQQAGEENVFVSLTGVPSEWIEPASFSMSRGIRFVYLSPKSPGSYVITVRSGSEEKNVTLFVAKREVQEPGKKAGGAALLVLLLGFLLLLSSKKPGRSATERKEYLGVVKKEIENKGRVF